MSTSVSPTTWIAFLSARGVPGGSVWLSLGRQLKACPSCFHQRTFVMSIVGVMGLGLPVKSHPGQLLSLLSLRLAAGGIRVAVLRVWLEASGKRERPNGVAGIGTAPQPALAGWGVVILALLADAVYGRSESVRPRHLLAGVGRGMILSVAAVESVPPAPDTSAPDVGSPRSYNPGTDGRYRDLSIRPRGANECEQRHWRL